MNDLLIFARVVEARSLTVAATELGLPKSSVSRRLAQLEERLGVRLVQRTTRRFALTDIGETYYQRCATIMAEITAANNLVTDMQATPRGKLRITAPSDMSARYIGKLVSDFVMLHPDINVELLVTDRVVDLIEDSCDLAIRVGNLRESTLIARKLTSITAILVAAPAYLARRGRLTSVEDLDDHDFATFVPESVHGITITDGVRVRELPVPRFSANHYAPVRDALLAGMGIGNMTGYSVASDLESGALVQVLPEWTAGSLDVSLVYPARRNMPPRLSLFIEHLMAAFAPPPWERASTSLLRVANG